MNINNYIELKCINRFERQNVIKIIIRIWRHSSIWNYYHDINFLFVVYRLKLSTLFFNDISDIYSELIDHKRSHEWASVKHSRVSCEINARLFVYWQ